MAADADGNLPLPADLEKDDPSAAHAPSARPSADEGGNVVRAVVDRWRREDLLDRCGLVLRSILLLFSLLAAIITATNKHGDWKDFDRYQEYKYLLGVSIIAFLYSAAQVWRQAHRFSTGKDLVPRNYAGIVDFSGDQVVAYLLISGASAAIPLTNRMREGSDNIFTDASSASITPSSSNVHVAAVADGNLLAPSALLADPSDLRVGLQCHRAPLRLQRCGTAPVRAETERRPTPVLSERSSLVLRALPIVFSLLSAVILVFNKHVDGKDFDLYQEFRYLLAVSVLSFLYSVPQLWRRTRRFIIRIVDFAGDQDKY